MRRPRPPRAEDPAERDALSLYGSSLPTLKTLRVRPLHPVHPAPRRLAALQYHISPVGIGLIPALAWGLLPIVVSRIGGSPSNQLLGTTAGTFIVGLTAFLYQRPETSTRIFLLCALSEALWMMGQIGQYHAYAK